MGSKSNAIKAGHKNIVYFSLNTLMVELEIDPDDASSQDDKYTLFCSDDDTLYKKTLTVKDDQISGDKFLTLKFTNLIDDNKYTLEVDPGEGEEPYQLFAFIHTDDLLSNRFSYSGSEEEEDDPDLDPDYEESEDAQLPYNDADLDDEEQLSDDWESESGSDEKLSEEWEQESDSRYYDNDDEDWERS